MVVTPLKVVTEMVTGGYVVEGVFSGGLDPVGTPLGVVPGGVPPDGTLLDVVLGGVSPGAGVGEPAGEPKPPDDDPDTAGPDVEADGSGVLVRGEDEKRKDEDPT